MLKLEPEELKIDIVYFKMDSMDFNFACGFLKRVFAHTVKRHLVVDFDFCINMYKTVIQTGGVHG